MAFTPCRPKWKGHLTDRERFNAQMHYRTVDRSFNMEFGYWEENFTLWPLFKDNGIRNNWEADRFFSFDRIEGAGGSVWLHPCFEPRVISETADLRVVMNDDGLLAEVPKDGHNTIPHYIKASIVTPDDWKRCKGERLRRDDPARRVDAAALRAAHLPTRDYPLGVNCGSMIGRIRDMLTFEGLAYACYDYPEMVEDMVETACVLVEDFLDQVLPHMDFDYASGWEDICFKNGPIVSLDFFTNVIVPRYKRIGRKLRAAGIDLWYTDCDGDVRPLMPGFLEAGINCLFPYEVNSCVHPAVLLKEYGRDLRIMGGVDKLEMRKGPAAIKAYLETLVPLVERGGYIPFCDHRCPPDVKPEDYLYYLDLKERMFGMKSRKAGQRSASRGRKESAMLTLVFYVPETHLEAVKAAVFEQGAGRYRNYDCCAWQVEGTGQFRPLDGSKPFIGQQGALESVREFRVEMICPEDRASDVVAALRRAHPYEEPAFALLPHAAGRGL